MDPEALKILQMVVDFLDKGNTLSQEDEQALVQFIHFIENMGKKGPTDAVQQTPEEPGDLQSAPHPSSNINAFRYDPQNQRLFVKFQDKYPGTNGPVYSYEGVPKYIVDVFARGAVAPKTSGKNQWHAWKEGKTPSHGAAMYALIKQAKFPYKRLS